MNTFKEGERVLKARYYSSEKYCEQGGDESEVPIGSIGTVDIVKSDNIISVDFDNGVNWNLNVSELDHYKFNVDDEFKRCMDKLEARKKSEELAKKREEEKQKRMKQLQNYFIGEAVRIKKEMKYESNTIRQNALGIINSFSTIEPKVRMNIIVNTEGKTNFNIYADVNNIAKFKLDLPVKVKGRLFIPTTIFELEKLPIEEQLKRIIGLSDITKLVKEKDYYLITTKNLKATYSGKTYDIGAYELKLYKLYIDSNWIIVGRNLNGGFDTKDGEHSYRDDNDTLKYYKCHNPFLKKWREGNSTYRDICFGDADGMKNRFVRENKILELIQLTLSNLTSSSNAGYTQINTWVKMLK